MHFLLGLFLTLTAEALVQPAKLPTIPSKTKYEWKYYYYDESELEPSPTVADNGWLYYYYYDDANSAAQAVTDAAASASAQASAQSGKGSAEAKASASANAGSTQKDDDEKPPKGYWAKLWDVRKGYYAKVKVDDKAEKKHKGDLKSDAAAAVKKAPASKFLKQ